MDINAVNSYLKDFEKTLEIKEKLNYKGVIKVGVDLGTANIVVCVVDVDGKPLVARSRKASVVKDGVVVDYIGAIDIVRELKTEVEEILGQELTKAATAIPPGIISGNIKVITNVIESCGMEVIKIVDEPVAAAKVLGIDDGIVVDVGGGTTGISILENGEVTLSEDEPTGGTHMTLVVAGAHGLGFREAEEFKSLPEKEEEVFYIVSPVIEKMASIVSRYIKGSPQNDLYIVGGASSFKKFEEVFKKMTGRNIIKTYKPLLVTPLGIALSV